MLGVVAIVLKILAHCFPQNSVFIVINFLHKLFKKVRDRRQRDWKFWTIDGKIFVKPDPINNVIVKIQSEEDLNKL